MTDDLVLYSAESGIARITLNRPQASNALDLPLAQAFSAAIDTAAADDTVRVVVVAGAGKRFCAGGDLNAMLASEHPPVALEELAMVADAAHRKLTGLAKPVIAQVQGAAAGAGLSLVLSCDVVITTDTTKFLMAYANVGLVPDAGMSYLLPKAVGTQRALEMGLLGKVVVGQEARDWGIATMVVPAEELEQTVTQVAEQIAAGAPFALGQAKRLLRAESTRVEAGLDEARTIAEAITTPEAQQLITAFTAPKK